MDFRTEKITSEFSTSSNLLRVQTFIKSLKKEYMDASILELISNTYKCIERLKILDEQIDKIDKAIRLDKYLRHKRDMLRIAKVGLVRQIDESNRSLEAGTHFLTTGSELLSVAEDLEKATLNFKRKVITRNLEKYKKSV